jgi:hypothetical protein
MMRTWGAYVHYLLRALGRLPNVACDVFRGYARPTQPPFQRGAVESSQVQAECPSLSVFGRSWVPSAGTHGRASVSTREHSQRLCEYS